MGDFRSAVAAREWGRALYNVIKTTHPDLRELCYEIWLANVPMDLLIMDATSVGAACRRGDPIFCEYVGYVFRLLMGAHKIPFGAIYYPRKADERHPLSQTMVPALGMQSPAMVVLMAFKTDLAYWMRPDHPRFRDLMVDRESP